MTTGKKHFELFNSHILYKKSDCMVQRIHFNYILDEINLLKQMKRSRFQIKKTFLFKAISPYLAISL